MKFKIPFIASAAILTAIVLIASFRSQAVTAPNGNDYNYYIATTDYGNNDFRYKIYNNYKFCFCRLDKHGNEYDIISGVEYNGHIAVGRVMSTANSNFITLDTLNYTGDNILALAQGYICTFNNGTPTSSSSKTVADPGDIPVFTNRDDCITYITTPDVDFDNVTYNPMIPTPAINPIIIPEVLNGFVSQDTNYAALLINDYPDYFVEVIAREYIPQAVDIGYKNGEVTYQVSSYSLTGNMYLASRDDLTVCEGVSFDDIPFSSIPDNSMLYSTTVPSWKYLLDKGDTVATFQTAIDRYNSYFKKCMPYYGNRIEFFVRLFTVQDGAVYSGAWRHWVSTYPSIFTTEIPSNYQASLTVPGIMEENNNVDLTDNTNTENFVGDATGVNNSITVNLASMQQYDYPTIATYNHDTVLTNFISTANQLPNFFGEFGNFLTVTFAFIPSFIWQLIGTGFLFSIIIMIIKVL